jgi:RND family efflux transporter MFP subunit
MKQMNIKLLGLVIVGFAAVSCGSQKADPKETLTETAKVEKVGIITLSEQTVEREVDYPCTLQPFEENYLAPAAAGRIEKIYVEVGSQVRQGQLIAQMDRTQLIQAETQLKTLELDYRRLDTLARLGSVAKQQYDQIKGQYDIAMTNVAFLRENTRLTAPFAGVIADKYFEDGELYSGTPNSTAGKAAIVHLIQINYLKALVSIPEQYFPKVSLGMRVKVHTDIYADETFDGTVFSIHPTIDAGSHTFVVEVKIPNGGGKLRPGMYTHVVLELGKERTFVVPAGAVLKLQGSNERYLFTVEDGKARRIPVQLGARYNENVEVIGDIKAGDRLVVKGQARLFDGSPVEATE